MAVKLQFQSLLHSDLQTDEYSNTRPDRSQLWLISAQYKRDHHTLKCHVRL